MRIVREVSFRLPHPRTLALVGESGSGKTTLALALAGLLEAAMRVESGEIYFRGQEVTRLSEGGWRKIRGRGIGFLFQDAKGALNPVLTVGTLMVEAIRAHRRMPRRQARDEAARLLEQAGIPEPRACLRRYPFELSTGLCQRVGIALGTCHNPDLLIADEPTSALDPSLQAQIIALIRRLRERHAMSLLLISHDLALVSGLADDVAVMYHGRIVESGARDEVIRRPAHPYTRALLACRPDLRRRHESRPLPVIAGTPPIPETELPGCGFAPRCSLAEPECTAAAPAAMALSESHRACCIKAARSPE